MAAFKSPKVLYFISASSPTIEDREKAVTFGPGTVFRNAVHVPESGALEACDAVAGDVPKRYSKLPHARDYIEWLTETRAADKAKEDARIPGEPDPELVGKMASNAPTPKGKKQATAANPFPPATTEPPANPWARNA